jgi:hypothetical protein
MGFWCPSLNKRSITEDSSLLIRRFENLKSHQAKNRSIKTVITDFSLNPLNLNSVNQLIFVMVKCGVLFEVRTGFLNNI